MPRRPFFSSPFRRAAAPTAELPPVEPAADPPVGHLFERRDLDLEALASAASTRFEQLYYGHRGRPMFKWAHYLPVYDQLLTPFVGKPLTLVEIGLAGGGSIDLWRAFLGPQIRIIGIDREPGCREFEADGVSIFIGDQGDAGFLRQVTDHIGPVDVVIDDGSHVSAHQILAFETFFPRLTEGGLYVCEDVHTSYWPSYGGGADRNDTFIAYAKTLIDKLHGEWSGIAPAPEDPARSLGAMLVTDSLIALTKSRRALPFMAWVGSS